MNKQLKVITRENWEEAIALKVNPHQQEYTPEVAISLAKIYIKPDGDQVQYIPFDIYDEQKMVGFIMHAYEENSFDMYWINGFLIDAKALFVNFVVFERKTRISIFIGRDSFGNRKDVPTPMVIRF